MRALYILENIQKLYFLPGAGTEVAALGGGGGGGVFHSPGAEFMNEYNFVQIPVHNLESSQT
jgi:hypothetical protein